MNNTTTQWVVVPENTAIIARDTGEVWYLDLDQYGDSVPFSQPMTCEGSRGSTEALLNAAVALAFSSEHACFEEPVVTLPRYVFILVAAYHNARRTPGNYLRAAARFAELQRPDLDAYLRLHAREETGHDRLAIKDLRALGLPAEPIVNNLMPSGAKPLGELFDGYCSSDYPIGCIGYSYCFESIAALKGKSDVDAMQMFAPEKVDVTRFLRTHSSLGSEVNHVVDLIDFIASLPACDRIEIVRAAYETAVTLVNGLRQHAMMSDAAILAEIRAAAGSEISLKA